VPERSGTPFPTPTEATTVLSEAATFLTHYFTGADGKVADGTVGMYAYRNLDSHWEKGETGRAYKLSQVDRFLSGNDIPASQNGCYFLTSTLKPDQYARSGENCLSYVSVFADLDDKNHDLPREKVIAILENLSLPPTFIVNSGHGLQPHWCLDRATDDFGLIGPLRKRLQQYMLPSDSVHDRPRVMRLPGSHNSKNGEWLPVQLVSSHPERRYAIEATLSTLSVIVGQLLQRPRVPDVQLLRQQRGRNLQVGARVRLAHFCDDSSAMPDPVGIQVLQKFLTEPVAGSLGPPWPAEMPRLE
jgi:hypothetical protein